MFLTEIKSQSGEDISILIRPDNHSWNYLCECGDASGLTVKECQNTQAIFISHTHIDHFINFDQILRHQIESKQRVVICGPQNIARQVQAKIQGYTWNLIQKGSISYEIREVISQSLIKVYELEPPAWNLVEISSSRNHVLFQNEKFRVYFTILDHKTPSIAYLFKEEDTIKIDLTDTGFKGGKWVSDLKRAYENKDGEQVIEIEDKTYKSESLFHLIYSQKGQTVGVIMDHAGNEDNHHKIRGLFVNCDKVFIECFYKDDDKEQAEKNYHSYASKSGQVMRECLVKQAIPVHFSRKYTDEDIHDIRQAFDLEYKK